MLLRCLFASKTFPYRPYLIWCHWKPHFPDSLALWRMREEEKSRYFFSPPSACWGVSSSVCVSSAVSASTRQSLYPLSQILPRNSCHGFSSYQEAWLLHSVDPSLPIVLLARWWWWPAIVANFWISAFVLVFCIICVAVSPYQIASAWTWTDF